MSDFFLPLHLISLTFVLWNVLRADHVGFLWIRGTRKTLDERTLKKYHRNIWIGFSLMIITGLFLFYPMREYLLERPQFYVKMSFILVLIINGLVIGKLMPLAIQKTFQEISKKEKVLLFTSGTVSTISWLMVIISALYLLPD